LTISALREEKTLSELTSEYGVHGNQIVRWKKEFLARAEEIFTKEVDKQQVQNYEAREAELYRQIGQLKVELDWLKKKSAPYVGR
jgi:putative transposase